MCATTAHRRGPCRRLVVPLAAAAAAFYYAAAERFERVAREWGGEAVRGEGGDHIVFGDGVECPPGALRGDHEHVEEVREVAAVHAAPSAVELDVVAFEQRGAELALGRLDFLEELVERVSLQNRIGGSLLTLGGCVRRLRVNLKKPQWLVKSTVLSQEVEI